eukprot:1863140-Alexandrium_andersonii.AAC.1
MSASLVGSEMCIRDREWAQNGQCDANKDHMLKRCQLSCCKHMGDFNTVSYTHLTLPTICSV